MSVVHLEHVLHIQACHDTWTQDEATAHSREFVYHDFTVNRAQNNSKEQISGCRLQTRLKATVSSQLPYLLEA